MQTCSKCKKELPLTSFTQQKNGKYTKGCVTCKEKDKIKASKKRESKKPDSIPDGSGYCNGCFKILTIENFKTKKNGELLKKCNSCSEKIKNRGTDKSIPENTKLCSRCKNVYPLENFPIRGGKQTKTCKPCLEIGKRARIKINNKISEAKVEDGYKYCSTCKNSKPIEEFKDRSTGGKTSKCITCINYMNSYLDKNKCEHGKKNKSACKECNGASICEHNKIKTYCTECDGGSLCVHKLRKDRCKHCKHLYGAHQYCEHGSFKTTCVECEGGCICEHKKRRRRCEHCDFGGYLASKTASKVKYLIRTKESKVKIIEYLCCDISTYRKYLEDQFVDGMTWENYGKVWDIDHIVPIKYQNPTVEEIMKRLHYTNTQPLWKKINNSKGNRFIYKLVATGGCPQEEGETVLPPSPI
jgi:hypothetical protein